MNHRLTFNLETYPIAAFKALGALAQASPAYFLGFEDRLFGLVETDIFRSRVELTPQPRTYM